MTGEADNAAGRRVVILVENLSVPFDRRVWQEARSLTRAGYEVTVICPQGFERDSAPFERIEGVAIHRYRPRTAGGSAASYLVEYGAALWDIARLLRRVRKQGRIDVVHACNPPDLLLLAALPLRWGGTRFIFDHHDLVPELYLSRFGGRGLLYRAAVLLEKLTFRLADIVLSTNDSYREIAIERGGKDPTTVFVVRNGPDLERFSHETPDPSLRRGKQHLIAYLGVIGPQDGVDHALRALSALRSRRMDWHAIIAGDGDALSKARELSTELGLDSDVEFTGRIGDGEIVRLLSSADVCIAPEPSSPLNDRSTMIKIAEYMAMRRPVVAYDLKESRRTAGGSAVYAAVDDVDSFATCIEELLGDPARRAEMGLEARRRVEATLSWERSEDQLLHAYEAAISSLSRSLMERRMNSAIPSEDGQEQ